MKRDSNNTTSQRGSTYMEAVLVILLIALVLIPTVSTVRERIQHTIVLASGGSVTTAVKPPIGTGTTWQEDHLYITQPIQPGGGPTISRK